MVVDIEHVDWRYFAATYHQGRKLFASPSSCTVQREAVLAANGVLQAAHQQAAISELRMLGACMIVNPVVQGFLVETVVLAALVSKGMEAIRGECESVAGVQLTSDNGITSLRFRDADTTTSSHNSPRTQLWIPYAFRYPDVDAVLVARSLNGLQSLVVGIKATMETTPSRWNLWPRENGGDLRIFPSHQCRCCCGLHPTVPHCCLLVLLTIRATFTSRLHSSATFPTPKHGANAQKCAQACPGRQSAYRLFPSTVKSFEPMPIIKCCF